MIQPVSKSFNAQPWLTDATGGNPVLTHVSGTVPSDTVIDTLSYSQTSMTLSGEMYRGGRDYTPVLKMYGPLSGAPVTVTLTADGDRYTFSEAITFTGAGLLRLLAEDGGQQAITITVQETPPTITGLMFKESGGIIYPENTDPLTSTPNVPQTAVKNNDEMIIVGTLDKAAAEIKVKDFEATSGQGLQMFGPFSAGAFEIAAILMGSGNASTQHVRAYATLSSGAPGSDADSSNFVEKDQDAYTVPDPSNAYPANQSAIKTAEICTATSTVSGYGAANDSILYDSTVSEVTPTASTTYTAAKVWTYATGGYRETGNNARIRAWKAKNGLLATRNFTIRLANTAPLLTLTHDSKLRSQAATHTITGSSDQYIADGSPDLPDGRPTLQIPVGGGTLGGRSGLEGFTWTWPLTIDDTVVNAQYAFTLAAGYKNRAGVAGSIRTTGGEDDTYDVGAFESRDIVGVAFQEHFPIGKAVDIAGNVTCERVGVGSLTFTATPSPPETGKFSLSLGTDGYDANGTHIWWLDDPQRNLGLVETMRTEETVS